jgi:hypothetical protein
MEKKTSGYLTKKKDMLGEFTKSSYTAVLNQTPKTTVHNYSRDKKY